VLADGVLPAEVNRQTPIITNGPKMRADGKSGSGNWQFPTTKRPFTPSPVVTNVPVVLSVKGKTASSAKIVEGDVLDRKKLDPAIAGQDVVYANLTGDDLEQQAKSIIASMKESGVARLILIASLGIYDEIPGKFGDWNRREIARIYHRSGRPRT
jgi:hypothetical protein